MEANNEHGFAIYGLNRYDRVLEGSLTGNRMFARKEADNKLREIP